MAVAVTHQKVSAMQKLVVITSDITHLGKRGIVLSRKHSRILLLHGCGQYHRIALFHLQRENSRNEEVFLTFKSTARLVRICDAIVPVRSVSELKSRIAELEIQVREAGIHVE